MVSTDVFAMCLEINIVIKRMRTAFLLAPYVAVNDRCIAIQTGAGAGLFPCRPPVLPLSLHGRFSEKVTRPALSLKTILNGPRFMADLLKWL